MKEKTKLTEGRKRSQAIGESDGVREMSQGEKLTVSGEWIFSKLALFLLRRSSTPLTKQLVS